MTTDQKTITFNDLEKCHIHVGTIVAAELDDKARNPTYVLTIDFGQDIGFKKSSAQISDYHMAADYPGLKYLR